MNEIDGIIEDMDDEGEEFPVMWFLFFIIALFVMLLFILVMIT